MREFVVMSDSALDLDEKVVQENGIIVVPFYVSMDGKTYKKDREEIHTHTFFEKVAANPDIFPKTSMPSTGDYAKKMLEILEQGKDVLCLCMSAKFTSSYQSALTAAELCREEYPDAKICVMDSTLATVLQGLFTLEACELSEAGVSLEDAVKRLEEIQKSGSIFFTVGNLDYLIHGGRIGKVKGLVARSLNLKPMILMRDGELFPMGVARTRKSSWKKMLEEFCKYVEENQIDLNNSSITTGYGLDPEEGAAFHEFVAKRLAEQFDYHGKLDNHQIGSALCVHTGPLPLGIGIIDKAITK